VSRYRFIAVEKAHRSVVLLCRVVGVAKSAFYAWQRQQLSARSRADEQLTDEIRDIFDASRCTYGAPRVHAQLRKRGKRVGRKRVARLMREAGLVGSNAASVSTDDDSRPEHPGTRSGATPVRSE
jgi:putative transposase